MEKNAKKELACLSDISAKGALLTQERKTANMLKKNANISQVLAYGFTTLSLRPLSSLQTISERCVYVRRYFFSTGEKPSKTIFCGEFFRGDIGFFMKKNLRKSPWKVDLGDFQRREI